MVKAIITDFDGVLRHWNDDLTNQLERECKLPFGTLKSMGFSADLLESAIVGKTCFERWVDLVHERIMGVYGLAIAERYVEAWQNSTAEIDHHLLAVYRSLFPQASIVLATNATTRFPAELVNANLVNAFDHVFNSSAMGVAKPKLEYFYAVLMSLGLKAKDVIFIDDSRENINAAEKLGIRSFHFQNRSQLIEQLMQLTNANVAIEI